MTSTLIKRKQTKKDKISHVGDSDDITHLSLPAAQARNRRSLSGRDGLVKVGRRVWGDVVVNLGKVSKWSQQRQNLQLSEHSQESDTSPAVLVAAAEGAIPRPRTAYEPYADVGVDAATTPAADVRT